jgi:ComF family protein
MKILPRRCVLCQLGTGTLHNLCDDCMTALPFVEQAQVCMQCALPLSGDSLICAVCQQHPPAFDATHALLEYTPLSQHLIQQFKFSERLLIGNTLSHLFAQSITHKPDAIIPVPLHRKRLFKRGFNQSQYLATHIGHALGIPILEGAAKRTQHTVAQHTLDQKARRKNLTKAFALGRQAINAQSIVILDDVMTTGSTVNAVAKCIKRLHPEVKITVWTMMRVF